ncbi:MAG: carboxylesterase family protein [Gammaproteobacteria bacterium]|nr:carboxylesterase family protein [Gammaproteobacteria bacterium]
MKLKIIASALAIGAPLLTAAQIVHTESGVVRGVRAGDLVAFKGLPYAAPPVGPLRWKPPARAARWDGTRAADVFAPACPQDPAAFATMGEKPLPTAEDCLYLNVWTPSVAPRKAAPVMVWIHGGGFSAGGTGTPMFDGAALASRGIVVVTVAYRLGALGFLAHAELSGESPSGVSGNYGLQDQLAALEWVQRNAHAFGGDPANVTLFGESAGAMSVSLLAASPRAARLFQRVIAQSGAAFAPARTDTEGGTPLLARSLAEARGAAFIARLGTHSMAEARQLPAEVVIRSAVEQRTQFAPVSDGVLVAGDAWADYVSGRYNHTPVIVGFNGDEGGLFVQSMQPDAFHRQISREFGPASRGAASRVSSGIGCASAAVGTPASGRFDVCLAGMDLGAAADAIPWRPGLCLSQRACAAVAARASVPWRRRISWIGTRPGIWQSGRAAVAPGGPARLRYDDELLGEFRAHR